jgi:hypothetical protein
VKQAGSGRHDAGELDRLAEERRVGLLRQYWGLARSERSWFLLPVLLALLVAGAFVVVGSSSLAPFIYALF